MKYLNAREKKTILQFLQKRFGYTQDLPGGLFQNEKDKLFYSTADLSGIDFKKIRKNSLGMYFGYYKEGDLRLSIEGSQMIGAHSTQNIFELSPQQAQEWLSGADLDITYENPGSVLLKEGKDFLGCAKANGEKFFNFVPKNRRVN